MSAPGDISLPLEGCRFNLRVSGILIREGHILAAQSGGIPYWYPPGGRVRQNEDSAAALRRELAEELGEALPMERLLWVAESFFFEQTSGERFHEIGFYYLLSGGEALPQTDFARPDEEGREQRFHWHHLSDIAALDLRPALLKERILDLPASPVHLFDYQDNPQRG